MFVISLVSFTLNKMEHLIIKTPFSDLWAAFAWQAENKN